MEFLKPSIKMIQLYLFFFKSDLSEKNKSVEDAEHKLKEIDKKYKAIELKKQQLANEFKKLVSFF